jgi:hypothetical protein
VGDCSGDWGNLGKQKDVRSRQIRKFSMMINKEHIDYDELAEISIQEKLKKLKRYAMDLNMIGYDVKIYSENDVDESDFELIIRKRPTAS